MPNFTRKKKSASRKRKVAKTLHASRFPGENSAYRKARDKLLKEEMALRRHTEAVAAQRRKLPLGGKVPEDYVFEGVDEIMGVRRVRLSELFSPGKDTLVIYNYMYGPAMERPCPMCTSMLDALEGNAHHIMQRVNLAVVAKSPLPRILNFAQERGWRRLRLLSSANNSYNRDYFGESSDGKQWPALNVFRKRGNAIHHFWNSELMFAPSDKGQSPRHVDFIWPLWNLLDATPEGRGTDWHPKLSY
ncbi:MAG TPA: DUF899 family protein [Gammaproteobacteria bacterium]|nr:DUF899 family protein [Gammaproteobacteria bacterium]